MVNQQLVDYIKAQKAQGYAPQQSRDYLVKQGYDPSEVEEAIKNAKTIISPLFVFLGFSLAILITGSIIFLQLPDNDVKELSGSNLLLQDKGSIDTGIEETSIEDVPTKDTIIEETGIRDAIIENATMGGTIIGEPGIENTTMENTSIEEEPTASSQCIEVENPKPINGILSEEFFNSEDQYSKFFISKQQDNISLTEECLPVFNLDEISIMIGSFGGSDFYIEKPDGEKITEFPQDLEIVKMYNETNPLDGIWKIGIDNKEASNSQISINIFGKVSDISIVADMDKAGYKPNELASLRAKVYFNQDYILNGKVEAIIFSTPQDSANVPISSIVIKPIKKVELLDDGKHNDGNAKDGIFANTVKLAEEGNYPIQFRLAGSINNKEILREDHIETWVKTFPDLTVTDISFSNNNPKSGDNIILSAIIENIGNKDANDVEVEFYYPGNYEDVLIGTDTIDVQTSEKKTASVEWKDIPQGTHDVSAVVSPFGDFLEENYENNRKNIQITVS